MNGRLLVWVGVVGLLLGACGGAAAPNARIVAFAASAARVPRGEPVTLTWQAADAGVKDGLLSCVLTRRFGDEPAATTLQATCMGSATDVPPAPVTAAAVHYRFEVLKQPYDEVDPYVASEHTVTLDAAKFAIRAGGTGSDLAMDVSTLVDGGAIVVGSFSGTATFGTTTLISAGGTDAFIARIHPDGTWAWAVRAGGTYGEEATGVSTLADGSAIVTGFFGETATFGADTLTSEGTYDVFVARVEADGTWAWATRAGGSFSEQATGVSTVGDGGAIVTGIFLGTTTFGTTTLVSEGGFDVFAARIRPDGTWAWAANAGGTDVARPQAVAAGAEGGAIVVGTFSGVAAFGTTTLTSAGQDDVFVARVDSGGTWTWATRVGDTNYDDASSVSALPDGGSLVAGSFIGTATFGTTTLVGGGGRDAFVARVLPDGTWAWATGTSDTDSVHAQGVRTLSDGGAIVTGAFDGTATFGTTRLTSAGSDDAFVARIDPGGTWAWAARAGGQGVDQPTGVAPLTDGGAIVTGYFVSPATFGTATLTSAGIYDVFVARIDATGSW